MRSILFNRLRPLTGEWTLALLAGLGWGLRRAGGLPLYSALISRLIERTRLFDREYYLQEYPDVARANWNPLSHYVLKGEVEGRYPMPLFVPAFYRAKVGVSGGRVSLVLHYAWVGRYRHISPHPWFDVAYYLERNPDVARSGREPLGHYYAAGAREGRSPSARFDGRHYIAANPDVIEAGANPLLHFLNYGRTEGRRALAGQPDDEAGAGTLLEKAKPTMPAALQWQAAVAAADSSLSEIDVIVPVYKGRAETLRCLYSVLTSRCRTRFSLIVINDAGPDAELNRDIEQLAERGLFTLFANQQNLGFVRTVNRGMSLHPDRDVVLLNSDAEVFGDWLDRFAASARRDPRIGTITPLSNNATVCSYPHTLRDNPYLLELESAELDALTAKVNAGVQVEAPTGVGFCMYIRRKCLDQVGLFDADTYGLGYGEENDFCQRAIGLGWANVLSAEVYVRHWGSASFQGSSGVRIETAQQLLASRYPNYQRDVSDFTQADPLAPARRRLDLARLKRQTRARNVLIVSHGRGGGTDRHIREEMQRLKAEGCAIFTLRPDPRNLLQGQFGSPDVNGVPNAGRISLAGKDALGDLCRELRITEIQVHSLVDFQAGLALRLAELARDLGISIDRTVHDYEVICPRLNLCDRQGRYCREPDVDGCNACLRDRGSDFQVTGIEQWRSEHAESLRLSRQVKVPDQDVADRLARYFPDVALQVVPHEKARPPVFAARPIAIRRDQKLRIVVVGAISRIKGYDLLLACAERARRARLPLDFVLMGYSLDDQRLVDAGVSVTGRYADDEAAASLHGLSPHAVWLPSTWPETYSYTLSLALDTGYPAFAFDIGAIARRLRALGLERQLMPVAHMQDAGHVVDRFAAYRLELLQLVETRPEPTVGTH